MKAGLVRVWLLDLPATVYSTMDDVIGALDGAEFHHRVEDARTVIVYDPELHAESD
jgi:hypothetical protein